MIDVFVDAIMFEPTNVITNNNDNENIKLTYLYDAPSRHLHSYISAFMDHSATVDCCVVLEDVPRCIG
jgi:hypothetical protein